MAVQLHKTYILGDYELEPDKRLLKREGLPVHLANRPFQVLLYLIEQRDRVVTRAELFDRFWDGKDVYDDALRKCIGAIRKALNDRLDNPRFIETRWAEGYRYIGPFEERSMPEHLPMVEIERTRGVKIVVEELIPDPASEDRQVATAHNDGELIALTTSKRRNRSIALAGALALVAISVAALIIYLKTSGAVANHTAPIQSIAVLPLKNLTGDPAQDYFTDGVTESLITSLSNIRGLKVISRTSAFAFKDKEVDARKVGQQLGVAAVLEGSIRRSAETIRVEVRLVSTEDGSILWVGDSYNRALTDILAVQDEIGCSVAAELRVRLCGEAEGQKQYTNNVEAYHAYLKGRYFWEKRSDEGLKKSFEYFQQAIEKDPNYALAYAGLSRFHTISIWFLDREPREATRNARLAAARAVEIDETLVDAHVALAAALNHDWNWKGAEVEFRRAIELNPGNAEAHHSYAYNLVATGRSDEAIAEINRALELDPLSVTINVDVGEILLYSRRYDESIEVLKRAIEMDYNRENAHWDLAQAYEKKGMFDEAVSEYLSCESLKGEDPAAIAALRDAYRVSGMRGFWQQYLEQRREKSRRGYFPPLVIAGICVRAGQVDESFKWIEKAYEEHSPYIMNLNIDPMFDTLRADARFTELLGRTSLPD